MSPGPVSVLHLIDHMGSGGAQRVILDLLEPRASGGQAAVVSLRSHCLPELRDRMEACRAPYTGLGLSRRNPLPLHRVRRTLRDAQPHVLHTHLEFSNELGILAARSLGRSRPRTIVHVHNDPVRHYRPLHRWLGRALAPCTDCFIVPSANLAQATRAAFGRSAGRIEIIPYGIDPAWLDRKPRDRGGLAERESLVIGTMARMVPQKSLHDLIEAMPGVLAAKPDARLVIHGDGPLRPRLEARARDLGLADAVEFPGFAHDPAAAYAQLDVFVLPSKNEGMPISLLEATAMGIPVVGTRVPGISELIDDGRTGLLVPHGDPTALANAILRLFSDEELRARIRSQARDRVARLHTRDVFSRQVEALYVDLGRGTAGPS